MCIFLVKRQVVRASRDDVSNKNKVNIYGIVLFRAYGYACSCACMCVYGFAYVCMRVCTFMCSHACLCAFK
jgi:hypothetical protein